MKTPIPILLLCLFSLAGYSQAPAPDFLITDSEGQPHELYADYLDEGKTVVLKLFFTFCPPCNAMAPSTQTLYEEWGEGDGDVEFISLSIMANDSDTDVNSYKNTHGLSYPGAGGEGNSIAASNPYTNGNYGFFLGTPTFVVISPDGTVNYDPRGSGMAATIDSVDAAIAATGASRFTDFTGSGRVTTVDGEGMAQVRLYLEGRSDTLYTDDEGYFMFETSLPIDQPQRLVATRDVNDDGNGISTNDLILIAQHILGVSALNGSELIAADANRSGNISIVDLIRLQRFVLGINDSLQDQPSWIFLDADYNFDQPNQPFDEVYGGAASLLEFDTDRTTPMNLRGIKIGDVNHSADPNF
ncbi:MAG: redoxin domain-containing protein [Bacteroidetes bacterium]|jgi:thiol-disulfide isomerase/thioredoxin|nr:redoxin domain-containing protein [Bacteroidota bacterium]